MEAVSGSDRALSQALLEDLDRQECLRLIGTSGVGRVAFDDGEGPTIIPVNYAVDGETLVFRTSLAARLSRAVRDAPARARVRVAFEIDEIDRVSRAGWSVLLRGGARHVPPIEAQSVAARVEPWPIGERDALIRLVVRDITGRRIRRR